LIKQEKILMKSLKKPLIILVVLLFLGTVFAKDLPVVRPEKVGLSSQRLERRVKHPVLGPYLSCNCGLMFK